MKVLPNPAGDGDVDETRLAADETRLEPGAPAPSENLRLPSTPPRPGRADATPSRTSGAMGLSSSSGIDHGRFTPGTVLGDRYRIVGKLGKGGMGEVFRADDLKLGQQVALKFLPADVDRDPVRLSQLHTEVRMARQVSHPNVCRVYDIDEVDGHTFLSMEYVDGEDLASLLRRIGRFNEERGLEIARQICAGLAAAHERGVIHRDFKPANVMVDGAGHVRITDFGLAGVSGESIRAGTPAYMAPEQIAGAEVTARSDIYALGLVLYELFTGKRAIDASNLAELIKRRQQDDILPPSAVTNLSPEIDSAVMRCLSIEPAARPASAFAIAAALPGGDPLAAALAAGETPSPDMVAAAGEAGALGLRAGLALLSFTALGLLAVAFFADRTLLVNRVSFSKSADVLADRAREIITLAGYTDTPADTARGVAVNMEYLRWIDSQDRSPQKWDTLDDGRAPLLDFWYRTSPTPLKPRPSSWTPEWNDPSPDVAGMTTVVVDDRARLVEFLRVPPQHDASPASAAAADWDPLFKAAGLELAQFKEVSPQWTPRTFAEQRTAWEGAMPQRPDVPIRVEAASYRGQPVAFKVVGPWTRPSRIAATPPSTAQRVWSAIASLVVLALLAGAVLLVRVNTKSGRADRRGARRIAMFVLCVWNVCWFVGARHSLDLTAETGRYFTVLGLALLNAGFTWLFYLALEPFVRKFSPDMLIGWTRLLLGHLRDPRVGRDVLIGVATGVCVALLTSVDAVMPAFAGATPTQPATSDMSYFVGARYAWADVLNVLPNSIQSSMLGSFFYVLMLAVVRRPWVAATIVVLFIGGLIAAETAGNLWLTLMQAAIVGAVIVVVFLRFGLLALATAICVFQMLNRVPLTTDLSEPHAAISSVVLLIALALATYAFHISRAGDGLFHRLARQI